MNADEHQNQESEKALFDAAVEEGLLPDPHQLSDKERLLLDEEVAKIPEP